MKTILLGIIANLITDIGKYSLKRIIGNLNIQNQIELAYQKALERWSINEGIRKKEEIWTRLRIRQLFENATKHEISQDIDIGIEKLLMLFQEELLYHDAAWKFIQDIKFQDQLKSLININKQLEHIIEIVSTENININQLTEHLDLLSKTFEFQLKELAEKSDQIIDLIKNNKNNKSIEDGIKNWIDKGKYEQRKINYDILDGKISYDIKNETLTQLFFQLVNNKTWDQRISEIFKEIKSYELSMANFESKNLINSLLKIDLNQKYSNIQYEILEFFSVLNPFEKINNEINKTDKKEKKKYKELLSIKKEISALKTLSSLPRFGKCFLISGSAGSGKTHSINKLLEDDTYLKLSFFEYSSSRSFCDELIQKVNELSYQTFNTFTEIITFLNENIETKKIFIILENIERYKKTFLNEIFDLIDDTTLCPNIYWILTINYNFFDIVIEYENLFTKYTPFYKLSYNIDEHLYNNSGWINLDYINKIEKISEKIILQHVFDKLPTERVTAFKNNYRNSKNYITPFLAWIICQTWQEENENDLIDLIYLEIITKLDKSFKSKYDKSLSSFHTLQEFLEYTSILLISNQSLEINSIYLKNEISQLAKNDSILEDKNKIIKTISNLLILGLLRKNFTDLRNINLLYLNILPYWQYVIANKIVHIKDFEIEKELLNNFTNPKHESFKPFGENVCEFFLLIIDKERLAYDKTSLYNKFKTILINEYLPKSSFWFACLKMSIQSQERIVLLIKDKNLIPFRNKHDLFSFIQCVGFVKPKKYTIQGRFIDLTRFLSQIDNHKLSSAFLDAAKNIINETTDLISLFDSIQHLHGIEVLDIQEQISLYLIKHAFEISNDVYEVSVFLKSYLIENCQESKPFIIKSINGKGMWKRYFLREWLIYYFCNHIVNNLYEKSYYFFKEIGFYESKKGEFNYPIFIELERESNISIGRLFHHLIIERDSFIELIIYLNNSNELVDKINCFHIIRHTVPTRGTNKISLDTKFLPFLKNIYNDDSLRFIKDRFYEVFEYNKINFNNC